MSGTTIGMIIGIRGLETMAHVGDRAFWFFEKQACPPSQPLGLHSKLPGYVTVSMGYIEPRTHYLGNWSPREQRRRGGKLMALISQALLGASLHDIFHIGFHIRSRISMCELLIRTPSTYLQGSYRDYGSLRK